jgi:predicted glycosyltransferase involved in capsule biosynthesis
MIVFNNQKINIVTRIMGRLSFLEQTLPTWCAVKEIDEIVIVDWGMKEDLLPLIDVDKRITLLQVPDKIYFDDGATWNLGIRYTNSDYILMIDSDVMIKKSPIHLIDFNCRNKVYLVDERLRWWDSPHRGLAGTFILQKHQWEKINGFVEGVYGWGNIDSDFIVRLAINRYELVQTLNCEYFLHIDHGDDLRTENRKHTGSIKESNAENKIILDRISAQTQEHSKCVCHIINSKVKLMNHVL